VSWVTCKLGDICDIARGGSPRPIDKFLTDEEDGINWIKIGDATRSKKYIFETQEKIKREGISRSRLVSDGDFLLSNSMSFGRPYIMRTTGCIHDGWLVLSKYQKYLDIDFFYYLLSSPVVVNQFENLAQGSTVRNLNKELVSRVEVKIPPLPIQQKIVAKLDAIFAEIDKAIAAAEANTKNAEALFQSYLTEVFERENSNHLETTLGDYYDVRDGTHDSPKFHEEGYPLVTSKNLKNGKINFEKIQYISKQDYLSISQRSGVKKGDVLMAMIGTIGNPVVIETEAEFAIKNVALFKTKSQQSPHFLRYYLGSDHVIRKMEKDAKGATQKFVGLGYLRSFPINIPSSLEQQLKVVKKLEKYEQHTKKLLRSYTMKSNQLLEFKQSILTQAFNGQLVKESP
jgi:type I restriction enzyme S subunit